MGDIEKTLYKLAGKIEATNKAIDEKFSMLFTKMDTLAEKFVNEDIRISALEFNWKWVSRIAAAISVAASMVMSALINWLFGQWGGK
jgi:agmatine/peptidylarginine deiminase